MLPRKKTTYELIVLLNSFEAKLLSFFPYEQEAGEVKGDKINNVR